MWSVKKCLSYLVVALAFLFLLFMFSGCGETEGGAGGSTPLDTTAQPGSAAEKTGNNEAAENTEAEQPAAEPELIQVRMVLDDTFTGHFYEEFIDLYSYQGHAAELIVPAVVEGLPVRNVVGISNNMDLHSIIFSDGIKSISAVGNDPDLVSVDIPGSVKSLSTFLYGCDAIESVVIPEGVEEIVSSLRACKLLKNVSLPNSLRMIVGASFSHCDSLTSLVIPEGVVELGDYVLSNCPALSDVSLPSTLEVIQASALSCCGKLSEITLPAGLQVLDGGAFSSDPNLSKVTILPNGPVYVGSTVFWGTPFLDAYLASHASEQYVPFNDATLLRCNCGGAVTIPERFQSIAGDLFDNYGHGSDVVSIDLPDGLLYIGGEAFSNTGITSITIPDTVIRMGLGAFEGCSRLKTITFPSIPELDLRRMFCRCSSLVEVHLPDAVETIPINTFRGCTSLESLVLPSGVKEIGSCAFMDCTALRDVEFPAGIEKVAWDSFAGTLALEEMSDGGFLVIGQDILAAYYGKDSEIIVPDMVKTVAGLSGPAWESIKTVALPEGVETIATEAFRDMPSLRTVTLPGSLKKIGFNAFSSCPSLEELHIPDSLRSCETCFGNCPKLTVYCSADNPAARHAQSVAVWVEE